MTARRIGECHSRLTHDISLRHVDVASDHGLIAWSSAAYSVTGSFGLAEVALIAVGGTAANTTASSSIVAYRRITTCVR